MTRGFRGSALAAPADPGVRPALAALLDRNGRVGRLSRARTPARVALTERLHGGIVNVMALPETDLAPIEARARRYRRLLIIPILSAMIVSIVVLAPSDDASWRMVTALAANAVASTAILAQTRVAGLVARRAGRPEAVKRYSGRNAAPDAVLFRLGLPSLPLFLLAIFFSGRIVWLASVLMAAAIVSLSLLLAASFRWPFWRRSPRGADATGPA